MSILLSRKEVGESLPEVPSSYSSIIFTINCNIAELERESALGKLHPREGHAAEIHALLAPVRRLVR
jgi:hypothetical protein